MQEFATKTRVRTDGSESGGSPGIAAELDTVAPAGRIGRFCVLRLIGAGGMGRVYSAYDPDLDRRVAIKVLNRRGAAGEAAERRLLREAQALAKLSHPNVVAVHEVGFFGERAFVAMEFVEGETLAQWVADKRFSSTLTLESSLDLLVQAGMGLAAAHRAGIVHRDFKPSNILIGKDGRVRVADFGLARGGSVGPDQETEILWGAEAAKWPQGEVGRQLTATGAVIGTPRYMAPEQLTGGVVDARADQFAFALVAWEVLCGDSPFGSTEGEERMRLVRAGRLRGTPTATGVNSRLIQALQRGLGSLPHQRHRDVAALVDVLDAELQTIRGTRRHRRSRFAAMGLGVCAAAALIIAATSNVDEKCSSSAEQFANVWNDERAASFAGAVARAGVPFADRVVSETRDRLDDFASSWTETHSEACLATLRGEQSAELLDLRMECLDRARTEAAIAIELLERGDKEILSKAYELLPNGRTIDRCSDISWLRAQDMIPSDPAQAAAARSVRARLERTRKLLDAVQVQEARRSTDELLEEAERLGSPPVRVEVHLVRAKVLEMEGELIAAETVARGAYDESMRLGLSALVPEAAQTLARILSVLPQQAKESHWLAQLAVGMAVAKQDPQDESRARAAYAAVLSGLGRYDDALFELDRAIQLDDASGVDSSETLSARTVRAGVLVAATRLAEARAILDELQPQILEEFGADHPQNAVLERHRGSLAYNDGDYAAALGHFQRSAEIHRVALGEGHHDYWYDRHMAASMLEAMGRYPEAMAEIETVLAYDIATFGEKSTQVADARMVKGNIAAYTRRFEEAAREFAAVEAIYAEEYGEIHPRVAQAIMNRGSCYFETRQFAAAEVEHRRGVTVAEKAYGHEHPVTASARVNLGNALGAQARWDEAAEQFAAAVAIHRAATPNGSPSLATALERLGNLAVARRRFSEAEPLHREALELRQRLGEPPAYRGRAALLLAEVIHEQRGYVPEVLALLRDARANLKDAGSFFDPFKRQVEEMAEAAGL